MLCYYVYHSITPKIADEMLHRRVKQRIFQIYNEGLGLAALLPVQTQLAPAPDKTWWRGWVRICCLVLSTGAVSVACGVTWQWKKVSSCWEINFLSENKEAKSTLAHNVSPKHGLGSSAQLWRYHDPPGALRWRYPECCRGLHPSEYGLLLPCWWPRTTSSKWQRARFRLKLTWRSFSSTPQLIRMTTIESLSSLKITSNISPVLHLQRK